MSKLSLICIAVVSAFGLAASSLAKEKEAKVSGSEAFAMDGKVTKYETGICMQAGIQYDLHPKSGEAVHLSDGHRHDLMVLGNAAKDGSTVHVEGTWMTGVECKYVKVSKAMQRSRRENRKRQRERQENKYPFSSQSVGWGIRFCLDFMGGNTACSLRKNVPQLKT